MKKLTYLLALVMILSSLAVLTGCGGEEIKIGGQADLVGKTIGVQMGTIGHEIADDVENAKVEAYDQYVDAVTSLKQKKVDALIMDKDTADAYVQSNDELQVLDVGFEPEQYAVAVDKGNDELLTVINQVIASMKADGSLEASKESHKEQNGEAPDYNTGAAGGVLVVGTEPGFPPYEYLSGDLVIGTDIDIMANVAKAMDMELVVESMAFNGLIPALNSGKIDAIAAGMTVNDERKVNVDFSDHYTDASQVVVIRKASFAG